MPRVPLAVVLTAVLAVPGSALAAPTDPDTSFGSGGVTSTAFASSAFAYDIATHPSGGFVAVGGLEQTGPDRYDWLVTRYDASGNLDPAFDGDGKLVDPGSSQQAGATAVAVDSAGSIYYTGAVEGTDAQVIVNKIDTTGAPLPFSGAIPVPGSSTTIGRVIALDSAGRVLVAGDAMVGSVMKGFVARFTSGGIADNTFDGDGVLFLGACGDGCSASSLAPAGADDIYVGTSALGVGRVVRLHATGGAFGEDTAYSALANTGLQEIKDVVLQDGKVVAAGAFNSECAVARLMPDGAPDAGFGTNGIGSVAVGSFCTANDVELDSMGRPTFAGESSSTDLTGVIGRFTATGNQDSTFVLGGATAVSPGGNLSMLRGLVLQGDKLVVAGQAKFPHVVVAARYVGGVIMIGGSTGGGDTNTGGGSTGGGDTNTGGGSTGGGDTNTGGGSPSTPSTPSSPSTPSTPSAPDTVAPAVGWSSPQDNTATSNPTPTLSGTASDDPGDATSIVIDFRVLTSGGYVAVPGYPAQLTAQRVGRAWSVALPTRLPDGVYFARAYHHDAAGNHANGGNGAPILFRVDTTAPKPVIGYPANGRRTTDPRPIVSGTTADSTGDGAVVRVAVRRLKDGKPTGATKRGSGRRSGVYWSVRLPRLVDGDYAMVATQSDDAGNSGQSPTVQFKVGKLPVPSFSGIFHADGTADVGNLLSVRMKGQWTPTEDLRVRYRWQRCRPDKGCDYVSGLSDSPTYRIQPADRTYRVRAVIFAENPDREARPEFSTYTEEIAPADQIPYIANGGYPRVTTTDIAVNDTVKAFRGDWRGYPSGDAIKYSFRWQICRTGGCFDVATGDSYRIKPQDQGHRINVIVTARNRAGSNTAWSGTGKQIGADRAALRRALVVDSYRAVFGRDPEAGELAYWMPRSEDLSTLIANHRQFIRDNRSIAEGIVRKAYEKVYGHAPYTSDSAYYANQTAQFNNDVAAEMRAGSTYDELVTQYATALARQAIEQIFWWRNQASNAALVEPHIRNADVSRFVDGVRRGAYSGERLWTEVALSNEPLHGAARTEYKNSEGAATREDCYGAVGPGCTGAPGSTSTVTERFTTLDGRKMAYLTVTTAVGSILHDAMCRAYPWTSFLKLENGGWCGSAKVDAMDFVPIAKIWMTGAAEWNKATGNTLQDRKWFDRYGPYPAPDAEHAKEDKVARTYSDDLRPAPSQYRYTEITRGGYVLFGIGDFDKPYKWPGKEIRGSLRLEAPPGTKLDWSDKNFCRSGRFKYTKNLTSFGQRDYNVCA